MKLYLNKEQLEYQHHRWGEDNPVPSASGASHYLADERWASLKG